MACIYCHGLDPLREQIFDTNRQCYPPLCGMTHILAKLPDLLATLYLSFCSVIADDYVFVADILITTSFYHSLPRICDYSPHNLSLAQNPKTLNPNHKLIIQISRHTVVWDKSSDSCVPPIPNCSPHRITDKTNKWQNTHMVILVDR